MIVKIDMTESLTNNESMNIHDRENLLTKCYLFYEYSWQMK